MENGFDISGYINELAAVAVVTGIICLLGDRLKGGMGKLLSVACSLVIALFLVLPLADLLNENITDSGNLPPIHMGDSSIEDHKELEEYYRLLAKATIENLEITATREIEKKTKLTNEEFEITFIGKIENESFILESCTVDLKTLAAVSKRHDIEIYVEENYGCPCIFKENLAFGE